MLRFLSRFRNSFTLLFRDTSASRSNSALFCRHRLSSGNKTGHSYVPGEKIPDSDDDSRTKRAKTEIRRYPVGPMSAPSAASARKVRSAERKRAFYRPIDERLRETKRKTWSANTRPAAYRPPCGRPRHPCFRETGPGATLSYRRTGRPRRARCAGTSWRARPRPARSGRSHRRCSPACSGRP